MSDELEKDEKGMVIVRPVLSVAAGPIAESSVLLRIVYAENQAEFEAGGKPIQFVLTPPAAQELAELLQKQVQRILAAPRPKRSN